MLVMNENRATHGEMAGIARLSLLVRYRSHFCPCPFPPLYTTPCATRSLLPCSGPNSLLFSPCDSVKSSATFTGNETFFDNFPCSAWHHIRSFGTFRKQRDERWTSIPSFHLFHVFEMRTYPATWQKQDCSATRCKTNIFTLHKREKERRGGREIASNVRAREQFCALFISSEKDEPPSIFRTTME